MQFSEDTDIFMTKNYEILMPLSKVTQWDLYKLYKRLK